MKKIAIVLVLLCWAAPGCKDTERRGMWGRTTEPRLADAGWKACTAVPLAAGRVVSETHCGTPVPQSSESCGEILTYAEAVQRLPANRVCISEIIRALERFAAADGRIWSDVAAAYYVRAQREDKASDLLAALAAAEKGVRAASGNPSAHFNLALVQEAIGLREEALASWARAARTEDAGWRNEANQRRQRLQRELASDPADRWKHNAALIPAELDRGNENEVARLIEEFPRSALTYFERALLPAGNQARTSLFAKVLSKRLQDRFPIDVAAAAEKNRAGELALRNGKYAEASRLLKSGGSPLYLEAEQKQALALVFTDLPKAVAIIERAQSEAAARHYDYLHALIAAMHGYVLNVATDYLGSIRQYEAAIQKFKTVRDFEGLANSYRSNAGMYRRAGATEVSLRQALLALQVLPHLADTRNLHTVFGEIAQVISELGYPAAALQLQESALRRLRKTLMGIQPANTREITSTLQNVASALRGRAMIELAGGDYTSAQRDIRESLRLLGMNRREDQTLIEALSLEVEGRALAPLNPAGAIDAFTRALDGTPTARSSFRASILIQRAQAKRKLGRRAEAQSDLTLALKELEAEEKHMLSGRKAGEGERLWTPYFGRFADAHRQLIRLLVEDGNLDEAFARTERMHAFELLHLVRRNGPMKLEEIQANLPEGTVLVQYCLSDDRSFAWIVSRDRFDFVPLPAAGRDAVLRWTRELQETGSRGDDRAFDNRLDVPYRVLIAPVLAKIRSTPERLVLIPDDAMHGLPFAALRDPLTKKYLIEQTVIEIDGSATLYVLARARDSDLLPGRPSALLVGNPSFASQWTLAHGLGPLRFAEEEVAEIRPLYEPRVDVLVGGQATPEAFLRLARNKNIVHFAGHSIVNPSDPSQSLLLLAQTPGDNGAVTAETLLKNLDLQQTRLVVLASCNSAGGFPVGPEGVSPLVRPLIAAGVPAIVGTLWNVNDATAKPLSVSFHRHYGQGHDAAKALQRAQLDLLRDANPGLRLALAWAPFQVIGHASSPFEPTQRQVNGGKHRGIHRTNPVHRDDGLRPQ